MKWDLMDFQEVRLYYVLIILVYWNWVIRRVFLCGKVRQQLVYRLKVFRHDLDALWEQKGFLLITK